MGQAQTKMDRPLQKNFWQRHKRWLISLMAISLIGGLWLLATPGDQRIRRLDIEQLQLAQVKEGIFSDMIPLRGQVRPLHTYYLDAIEGGRVEAVHAEEGKALQAGDLIVEISNTRLQLDSISREAQVSEQINLMQTQELNLTRTLLEHQRSLQQLNYDIDMLKQQLARMKPLITSGSVRLAEVEDSQRRLDFLQQQRELTLETQKTDQALRDAQMKQMRDSITNLQANLQIARRNLESLRVRAPAAGRLTAFNLQPGESLSPGQRFGQLDDPDNYKLVAQVDELYLHRVMIGQSAQIELQGENYRLRVQKIYPQVTQGQFLIDMVFEGDSPQQLNRGQNFPLRLQLSEDTQTQLIPQGSFLAETGGHWIFVVEPSEKSAERRAIKVGRRNGLELEILEGLEPGDRVITSSYLGLENVDRLILRGTQPRTE